MKNIVVIGGGLSGLSTAFNIKYLAQQHDIKVNVQVVEKDSIVGGKIKSIKNDGYLFEWGPNGFLTNKPHTLELCKKLSIYNKLLASNDNARKRFVFSKGKLHKLPHSQFEFITNSLISLRGKIRIASEIFISRRLTKSDESLAEFTKRRLGSEALDKLISPMASGIFAGDPEKMSLKSCFPRIHQLEDEFGGLIKAMMKLAKKRTNDKTNVNQSSSPAGPGGVLTSFNEGIQTLTDSLYNAIGEENVMRDKEVISLYPISQNKWAIKFSSNEELIADEIILATPAYASSKILSNLDGLLSNKLAEIKYSPLAVVCLGYKADEIKHDLNGFGYLFANHENSSVLGTLWDSSIFANRAASGRVLLRSMLGGAKNPDILKYSDDQLLNITRSSIQDTMKIDADPDTVKIFRHEKAIPQYNIGHSAIVNDVELLSSKYNGLHLTGNAYYGVGINDCSFASESIAMKILNV